MTISECTATMLEKSPASASSPARSIHAVTDAPLSRPMKYDTFKVACSSCNLRELCLPVGMSEPQLGQLDELVAAYQQHFTKAGLTT